MSVSTARLHAARTSGGIVEVPVGITSNNGMGVSYYLEKRDTHSGNRLFYMPAEWARMSEAERSRASKFERAEIRTEHIDQANDLIAQASRADPGTIAAFKRLMGWDQPAPAKADEADTKAVKPGGKS